MADEIVVYSKQSEEERIPLTIRIEWLPDGTISPLLYWMPDGTCYKILSHSPSVPLAFLKDRGEGLRFKVRGEVIQTPDPESDVMLHTQQETYLYLAHKQFSEKNIVDGRYEHAGKEYISVTLDIFPDGDYELVYFWVHKMRYAVEKTLEVENHASFMAGGVGVRHKVNARLVNADDDGDPDPQQCVMRQACLYREMDKWFVAIKPL